MSAVFSRLKNWAAEKLTNEDLNAEFDNIYNNLGPAGIGDSSSNVAAMQTTTDPGEVGSENLATTLAGELERLRFSLKEIKGTDQWYETGASSISELAGALGGGLSQNRVIAGVSSANSSQPKFLVPSGSTSTLTLDATPTPFQYAIEGTTYSIAVDVTATSLLTAPTTNNTALINDTNAADGAETKYLGMYGSVISYDNAGTEITSRDGQLVAFKINNGADTEYFTGRIDDTNNYITDCRRGYFFNNSGNPIPAIGFSNNDTLTIMKLTWVFANTTGTLAVVYTEPSYSATEPSGPAIGDYWFDTVNNKWKIFNSSIWVAADATLIGICIQDENGNTVGARGYDFFKNFQALDKLIIERVSNTTVQTKGRGVTISVYGNRIRWTHDSIIWDITANLASGLTEASNTRYFLYIKEDGTPVMDVDPPLDRREELLGWYHPHETWRFVGSINNDGSSNLEANTETSIFLANELSPWANDQDTVGSIKLWPNASIPQGYLACNGDTISQYEYNELYNVIVALYGTATDTFTVPDLRGRTAIGVGTGSGLTARNLANNYGAELHGHLWYNFNGLGTSASTRDSNFNSQNVSTGTRTGGGHIKGYGSGDTSVLNQDHYTDRPTDSSMQPSLAMHYIIKAK